VTSEISVHREIVLTEFFFPMRDLDGGIIGWDSVWSYGIVDVVSYTQIAYGYIEMVTPGTANNAVNGTATHSPYFEKNDRAVVPPAIAEPGHENKEPQGGYENPPPSLDSSPRPSRPEHSWLQRVDPLFCSCDYRVDIDNILNSLPALGPVGGAAGELGAGAKWLVGGIRGIAAARPSLVAVRSSYLQGVADLVVQGQRMRELGASAEQIARALVPLRNQLKVDIRAQGSWFAARSADLRNLIRYGNRAGPTADDLFRQYGSWEKVVEAVGRTNQTLNRALGVDPL
jgi:hypothetical protein